MRPETFLRSFLISALLKQGNNIISVIIMSKDGSRKVARRFILVCLEVGEGGGFGFEGGDGFDEAGDGEGVADAAGAADEAEDATFASELDGDAHQRGDAGAVNLRDAVQDDDHF